MAFSGTGSVFRHAYFYAQYVDKKNKDMNQIDDSDDDENSDLENEFSQLFPRQKEKRKIDKDSSPIPDAMYVFAAIFFVAGVAAIASYQAYKNGDFGQDLGHIEIKMHDDSGIVYNINNTIYNETKLPLSLEPISYVLYIYPNVRNKNMTGLVRIKIKCKSSTSIIVLHSGNNKIRTTKIVESATNREDIGITSTVHNKEKSYLSFKLNETLQENQFYEFYVSFYSNLSQIMSNGIYLSDYMNGDGEKHTMVSTMFEAIQARNAFPCFDEPSLKATFKLIIQHESNYQALSNMPVEKVVNYGSNKETHFQVTPKMSTYLVGFVVTQYTFWRTETRRGTPIRVFAPEGRLKETALALEIAPLVIAFYEEVFKVNYTLPKLDLIPVTAFPAAADEIWGLILFQESYLLYNPNVDSLSTREHIVLTIAHEIAHQWFGDLVTPDWWSDTWLKESFAAYLEYLPVEKYYKSWDIATKFYDDSVDSALISDSSLNTHAIFTNEQDPVKLRTVYDSITYQKGSVVVAMLGNNFLSKDEFFRGVNHYLKLHEFGNANVDDFWSAMSEANGVNVEKQIHNWIFEPGFPMVTAKIQNGSLLLTQERFYDKYLNMSSSIIWNVPISIKAQNSKTVGKILLQNRSEIVQLSDEFTTSSWYKINMAGTGYFRTNYADGNWEKLLNQFNENHTVFESVDRANMISDVITMSHRGYLPLNMSLDFTKYLSKEYHYIPWGLSVSQLSYVVGKYRGTTTETCAKNLILQLIEPVLAYLNQFKSHTHLQRHLKQLMLSLAVTNGHSQLVDKIQNLFLKWVVSKSRNSLPTDIRAITYYAGIRYGEVAEWEYMLQYYKKSISVSEQSLVLYTLAVTENKTLLDRLVKYAFNEDVIKYKDRIELLMFVCRNDQGRDIAWEAIKSNWKSIHEQSKGSSTTLKYLISSCWSSDHTLHSLNEVEYFFANFDTGPFAEKLQAKIRESIHYNHRLWKRKDEFDTWLKNNAPQCNL